MSDRRLGTFILSYGRPDLVHDATLHALLVGGFTGPVHVVCSTDDPFLPAYQARLRYPDLLVFDKQYAPVDDTGDITGDSRSDVYARNMIPVLAAELGYTHYWQLDDDYLGFWHRAQMFVADDNDRPFLSARSVHDLDAVVDATLDFLDTSGATAIAFAQAGDFIGGLASGFWRDGLRRKAMNTFLARVDDPVRFVGRLNDDVNTVVTESMRGRIYFTLTDVMIVPVLTQQEPGGMTDAYAEAGTWVKSFMSVMYAPSAVRVAEMGRAIMRIHHQVTWNRVAPKILSDQHRKARA